MAEDRIREDILRETQSPYETVAFVFTDAFAGVHVGNAIPRSVTTRPALGRGACSPN